VAKVGWDHEDRHLERQFGPNGQVVGTEAYKYKLQWFKRLREFLESRFTPAMPLVVCGDLNVARDEKDVAHPAKWAQSILYDGGSRQALEHLLAWGLVDVFRQHHSEGGLYSWWDCRMLAFSKNDGWRLDYILATVPLAKRCAGAEIDRQERKGKKPSDHAPVWVTVHTLEEIF
jgi:exodeoxyribonuclease-3